MFNTASTHTNEALLYWCGGSPDTKMWCFDSLLERVDSSKAAEVRFKMFTEVITKTVAQSTPYGIPPRIPPVANLLWRT